jgi:cobalt-zinc-cadmium efflux system protein
VQHHHAHDHGLDARIGSDRRALTAAMVLIVVFMAGEIVAGVLAGSLALLADAGHMLTDAAALGFAIFAAAAAVRPARGYWTYGFRRVEILAAQVNGLALLLVGIWVVYASVRRLISPEDVHGGTVLGVALVGIAVNLLATRILARSQHASLNVRGAFLHLLTDLAAFVGTAIAGLVILVTGWNRIDPIASLLVAALMFWTSAQLLKESTRIFLEVAPADVDPDEVGRALATHPGVVDVHDLHVWTVTSGFPALSAHVLVEPGADCHALRRELEHVVGDRFGVSHTTLQVDHASADQAPPVRRRLPIVGR